MVSNDVLLEKISHIHDDLKEIKTDCKLNTQFRQRAKGFMSAIGLLGGIFGAVITKIISKIW